MENSIETLFSSHAASDADIRQKKADKILAILDTKLDVSESEILDIGTGSGHIIQNIARACKSAVSVNLQDERVVTEGYSFLQIEGTSLPFEDGKFDVVISNHVIEHMPFQMEHISEIHRVLKPNGIAYLATPNRFAFIEPHFKIPFLSWFPRQLSALILRNLRNEKWDIYPLSFGCLKNLVLELFTIDDMTLKIVKNPKKYSLDVVPAIQPLFKILPMWILRNLQIILPSFIVILHKR